MNKENVDKKETHCPPQDLNIVPQSVKHTHNYLLCIMPTCTPMLPENCYINFIFFDFYILPNITLKWASGLLKEVSLEHGTTTNKNGTR